MKIPMIVVIHALCVNFLDYQQVFLSGTSCECEKEFALFICDRYIPFYAD